MQMINYRDWRNKNEEGSKWNSQNNEISNYGRYLKNISSQTRNLLSR